MQELGQNAHTYSSAGSWSLCTQEMQSTGQESMEACVHTTVLTPRLSSVWEILKHGYFEVNLPLSLEGRDIGWGGEGFDDGYFPW